MHRPLCNFPRALVAPSLLAMAMGPALPAALASQSVRLPGAIPRPPTIDGRIDPNEWAGAARLEEFVQTDPGDNSPPSRRTEVFIAADGQALYLAVHAYDDPTLVRATLAPRDAIEADDHVDFHLDTFGDGRRAYYIAFNPLGIQEDGIFVEGGSGPDLTVDLVLRSRGRVTSDGWEVEAAIPFSSLRYASGGTRPWGLHVQRIIRHLNGEVESWRPIHRGAAGFLPQEGTLGGLTLPPVHRPLELIPSVTTLRSDARTAGPAPGTEIFRNGRPDAQLGATATLGLSADATLAGTWNPDFAQVEADAPVVTANQRFPIFYPEKRPFFLEGAELLSTPLRVVSTRAIVDPHAAIHVSGRRGADGFAVLAASDDAPGAQLGTADRSTIGVLRLRRDIGGASSVGLLTTGYTFPDRDNLTLGADGSLLGTHYRFRGQLAGTWARRGFYDPARDSTVLRAGSGVGYMAELRRTDRHLNVTLTGVGRSPDYVAEVGFTSQTDTHAWSLETRWDSERRPRGLIRNWSALFTTLGQVDWEGRAHYGYLWPHATLELPWLTSVALGPYQDWQRLFEEEFGARRSATRPGAFFGAPSRTTLYRGFATSVSSAPSVHWGFAASLDFSWDAFDYDFGAGPRYPRVSPAALADPNAPLDPGPGSTFDGTGSLDWRPAPAFRSSLAYTKSRLRRNDTGRVAYNEDLWSLTSTLQFSRFTSVRLRGDYQSSRRNFRPQLLLAWTPSPGSAIYAGYNDDLNRNGYSPVTGAYQPGVHRNARVAYLKISYLVHLGV